MSVDCSVFTVIGAGGFIGRALVAKLEGEGHIVHPITRGSLPALLATRRATGHVIDCVGLTGDFRVRPLDTADAHVGLVARCLTGLRFESFLLLSSTRVYARADTATEDAVLLAQPSDPADLYNVTKLAGEALCLADPRPTVRVVRLSNVYGIEMPAATFLGQVLGEGRLKGSVLFQQGPLSAKDYVSISAIVRSLPSIAMRGQHRLYNVAAGANTSHAAIAARLCELTGWRASFDPAATTFICPQIDTRRLTA